MIFDDYMFEDDDGEWVKYDDHIAEVENKACEWRVVEETAYKIYCETQCEGYHMFLATYHYCPYCGGKIKIKE
jgi:rRNA maturation endonuclease Nob1